MPDNKHSLKSSSGITSPFKSGGRFALTPQRLSMKGGTEAFIRGTKSANDTGTPNIRRRTLNGPPTGSQSMRDANR